MQRDSDAREWEAAMPVGRGEEFFTFPCSLLALRFSLPLPLRFMQFMVAGETEKEEVDAEAHCAGNE